MQHRFLFSNSVDWRETILVGFSKRLKKKISIGRRDQAESAHPTSTSDRPTFRKRSTKHPRSCGGAGRGMSDPGCPARLGGKLCHVLRAEDPVLGPPRPGRQLHSLCARPAGPADDGQKLGVLRDSGATLRARSRLSHDLGARKPWKETDPNFLPLELKQNLKARGYPHCQRWRLGGGGGQSCVPAWFPGPGSVSFLDVELVT